MTAPASSRLAAKSRAAVVALGIFSSRILGLLRERVVAHVFGGGPHADVFAAVMRLPNLLQNLLGEQTLSAAFIPTYSRLLEEGRERDAGRFAGAVFGFLCAGAAVLTLAGMALARPLVAVFTRGFLDDGAAVARGEQVVDRYQLAVAAVPWIFAMAGVLVISAWALGVLNSHRRFFLPYFAPVLWNLAIIAALGWGSYHWLGGWTGPPEGGPELLNRILLAACAGALVGALLQLGVQLPLVLRLLRGFRPSLSLRVVGMGTAVAAFLPALAGRGVVQLSAYLETFLAAELSVGSLAAVRWATTLYLLPLALFGMSVAASELPELARQGGRDVAAVSGRIGRALRQSAFLVVPTAAGFLAFGFLLVGALYRTGEFSLADNWLVYAVLCGYTLGLPASTASRLLQNLFFALDDTRTPARVALVRVLTSGALGAALMFPLDRLSVEIFPGAAGGPRFLGAVGLALGSAAGAWLELGLLRRGLEVRLPGFALPVAAVLRLLLPAVAAALPAALLWWWLPPLHVALTAALVVGLYGALYLALAQVLGLSELGAWTGRLRR